MVSRKTLLASVAVAAATLAAAPGASAADWYVNVAGGGSWVGDNSFSDSTNTGDTTFAFENDPRIGFVLSAAVGMHLNNVLPGLRVEGELGYRENDVNASWRSATVTSISSTPTSNSVGDLATANGSRQYQHNAFSIMANAWYDFQVAGLKPYVGGGIGWANVEVDGVYQSKAVGPAFSESGFAWQLGAGLHLPIDEQMSLGIGYRYFSGPDITIPAPSEVNPLSGSVDTETHSVTVGLTVGL
jgi:opacity protein-like surface antigen